MISTNTAPPEFKFHKAEPSQEVLEVLNAKKTKLKYLQEQFYQTQLKRRYLEFINSSLALQYKERMVSYLPLRKQEVGDKEIELEQVMLAENYAMFDKMRGCLNDIDRFSSEWQKAKEDSVRMQKEIKEKNDEFKKWNEELKIFDRKTLAELEPELHETTEKLEVLTKKKRDLSYNLEEQNMVCEEMKKELEQILMDLDSVKTRLNEGQLSAEIVQQKRDFIMKWYEYARNLLKQLLGFEVELKPEEAMVRATFKYKDQSMIVELYLNPLDDSILDVKCSPKDTLKNIDGIDRKANFVTVLHQIHRNFARSCGAV